MILTPLTLLVVPLATQCRSSPIWRCSSIQRTTNGGPLDWPWRRPQTPACSGAASQRPSSSQPAPSASPPWSWRGPRGRPLSRVNRLTVYKRGEGECSSNCSVVCWLMHQIRVIMAFSVAFALSILRETTLDLLWTCKYFMLFVKFKCLFELKHNYQECHRSPCTSELRHYWSRSTGWRPSRGS
jgi:hypothetical protein